MNLYWGDIHNHCGITYGYGGLENALQAAAGQLDFCSITPHAMWPDMPARREETAFLVDFHQRGFDKVATNWDAIKRVIEKANHDGTFVTLHSFEIHHSRLGDYHLLSPDPSLELLRTADFAANVHGQRVPCIAVPHHIGYTPGYRGIDWESFDETLSPVVEVFSKHGCAVSDRAPYPYYHDMGPRDSRNTAWAGLRLGRRFSFVGSSDHHAGYPGSYGDGRMAVLAEARTREDIWRAIRSGHTYAVTGDKIGCSFEVNGSPFGSRIQGGARRTIGWDITCGGILGKAVVYRNLRPLRVITGEELLSTPRLEQHKHSCYKVRIELGWGNSEDAYLWECQARVDGGRLLDAETCFRGRSVLTPKKGINYGDDINLLRAKVLEKKSEGIAFEVETFSNFSTLHPQTSAVILEVEGSPQTRLRFLINGRSEELSIGELLENSRTGQMEGWNSHAYKIHRAVPQSLYRFSGSVEDTAESEEDFYHMEILQENGQAAWVSPVFLQA